VKPSSAAVLRFLRSHPEGLTSQIAFRAHLGTRLSGRIFDLRAEGFDIRSEWEGDGTTRWARYVLVERRADRGVQEALAL
jgi:hypothetical protein